MYWQVRIGWLGIGERASGSKSGKELTMRIKTNGFALGVLLFALGLHAEAQPQKKIWHIGLFHVGLDHVPPSLDPLRQDLSRLGYAEGKNLRFDWHNMSDQNAANAMAREFVKERVDLIVAFESQTVRASKAATSEIPVVFLHVHDPVAEGFIKTFAHPGGNMTGFGGVGDVSGKRLGLFKEIDPGLQRVLTLVNPKDPATTHPLEDVRATAQQLNVILVERKVETRDEIERVFKSLKRSDADGVFVISPSLNTNFPSLFIRLTSEKRLPTAGFRKEWVEQGALFSYSHDLASFGAPAARYVDRILKGEKPGELPFQDESKFQFVINLKTAKTLGLTIPPNVLARADQVIR